MRQIYYYRLGSIAARLGCYAVRAGLKLRAAVALPPIFTLRGVLLFLEKSDDEEIEFQYESGTRIRNDGRTRCIFDNGTESDMLFRSLAKALITDGFGVSDVVSDDQGV